jgi:hypothetical protein
MQECQREMVSASVKYVETMDTCALISLELGSVAS